jgi:hypothetical protein
MTDKNSGGNVADDITKLILDQQKAIFSEIKEVKETLASVAVQKKEIEYLTADLKTAKEDLNRRLQEMENTCKTNHQEKQSFGKDLIQTTIKGVVGTSAVAFTAFICWILFSHLGGFLDFNRTQINAEPSTKAGSSAKQK